MGEHWYDDVLVPAYGRREAYELLCWLIDEQDHIDSKFVIPSHCEELSRHILPRRQIVQYVDRAAAFLNGARTAAERGDTEDARILEAKAQQALGKCITTAIDVAQSAIQVYGPMPRAAVPSGEIILDGN